MRAASMTESSLEPEAEPKRRPSLPSFDFFLAPGSDALKAIADQTVDDILDHEAERRLRKRARRQAHLETLRLTVGCIIANLALRHLKEPGGRVVVKLSHQELGRKGRDGTRTKNQTIPGILDVLTAPEVALITRVKGRVGDTVVGKDGISRKAPNEPSTIAASPRLTAAFLQAKIDRQDIIRIQGDEPIRLRNAHKQEIDYEDTNETIRMRRDMEEINGWLEHADIACLDPTFDTSRRRLQRIFNCDFQQGGRLYHGFWISPMKSERRLYDLRIEGEPVAELDFGQMSIRLLYAEAGITPPEGDLYRLNEPWWDKEAYPDLREVVKQMILTAIANNKPIRRLPNGTRDKVPRFVKGRAMARAIMKRHHSIRSHFYRARSLYLQRKEADLLVALLLRLKARGIVALPVHDAVIVKASKASEAGALMHHTFKAATGLKTTVTLERLDRSRWMEKLHVDQNGIISEPTSSKATEARLPKDEDLPF